MAKLAIQLALGYAVPPVILLIGRNLLPLIYTQDQAVVVLTAQVLIVVAAYQLFDCLQAAIIGALRGYKDTQFPMWLSISAYWLVALPMGYVLGRGIVGFDLGLRIFVGLGAGLFVVALVAAWRLNRVSRSEVMIKQLSEY